MQQNRETRSNIPVFDSFGYEVVSGDDDFSITWHLIISFEDNLSVEVHHQIWKPLGKCFVPLKNQQHQHIMYCMSFQADYSRMEQGNCRVLLGSARTMDRPPERANPSDNKRRYRLLGPSSLLTNKVDIETWCAITNRTYKFHDDNFAYPNPCRRQVRYAQNS